MGVFVNGQVAVLDYTVDWDDGYLQDEELITSSTWTVDPINGVTVESQTNTNTTATIKISGGVDGTVVRLINRIDTTLGRGDARTVTLLVGDR